MGVFSYVTVELPCPYCSHILNDFQSKDGILMQDNDPWTLRNFYTMCPKCNKWVEYVRKGTEFSSTDLINEGKEAVQLLREIKEDLTKGIGGRILNTTYENLEKLLKKTNYPADDTSWMNWYELKKETNV
jgi:hypothetical protein